MGELTWQHIRYVTMHTSKLRHLALIAAFSVIHFIVLLICASYAASQFFTFRPLTLSEKIWSKLTWILLQPLFSLERLFPSIRKLGGFENFINSIVWGCCIYGLVMITKRFLAPRRENKRLLVTNLILDMLVDDSEPANLILREVPEIDEETRKRFHDSFSSIKVTERKTYSVLKELYKQGLVECTLADLETPYEEYFEYIPFEKDNWDIWFRMTDKGREKYKESSVIIWKD